MRNLFVSFLILFSISGYGQGIPVYDIRIPTASTPFGGNVSRGQKVYNADNNTLYLCITAATSAETLTSASAKFKQIPTAGGYVATEVDPVFASSAAYSITSTNKSNWDAGYNYRVTSASGTAPLTLTLATNGLTGSITQAATGANGYLSSTDWNTFNNKVSFPGFGTSHVTAAYGDHAHSGVYQPAGTYVTSVSGTSPISSSGGTTPAISISQANTSTAGYLSSTDWNTFNNKVTMTYPAAGIALSTGSAWGTSITNNSANWNTAYGWGNHASAGYVTGTPWTGMGYITDGNTGWDNSYGFLTSEVDGSTTNEIQTPSYTASTRLIGLSGTATTATIPLFGAVDATPGLVNGCNGNTGLFLRGDNTWQTPTNTTYSAGYGLGLSGTTFYNSRYWKGQDTLKTTLTGLVKATSGVLTTITDNSATWNALVSNATHTGDATGSTALTVVKINGVALSGLATGILKNTTTTGVPSIAIASDFPTLNQNTTGTAAGLTSQYIDWNSASGGNSIANKPSTFTPASHTHGNITNAGYIGTTATLPIITGTGGILQAGSFGTAAGTFCVGNDSRLSDARTPTAHAHGNITNTGYVGSTANIPLITGTGGIVQAGAFGTGATNFCVGNDARLSDARTPVSHAHGNITNAGAIGSTATLPIITTTSGVLAAGSFGSAAGTFAQGNDSRLSDARTPTAHVLNSASHTVSGLTTGHFLKATSATTFGFAAHGLTYTDVGAAASGHNHSGTYEPANANIQSHISSTSNPHSVTKSQIGLGNVENTTLSTWAGSTNITTLGTIATGVWTGTPVGVTKGGTALTGLGTAGQSIRVNAGATGYEFYNPIVKSLNYYSKPDTLFAIGNSITAGYGLSSTNLAYPKLISNEIGSTLVNAGVSGSHSTMQDYMVHAYYPLDSTRNNKNKSVMLVAYNTMRGYAQQYDGAKIFEKQLYDMATYLAIPQKYKKEYNQAYKKTAGWTATTYTGDNDRCYWAKTTSDSLSFKISGSAIYIGQFSTKSAGSLKIYVDGVLKATQDQKVYTIYHDEGVNHFYTFTRIGNLADSMHVVTVKPASTDTAYFQWISSNDLPRMNEVFVGNCLKQDAVGYSTVLGNDSNVYAYNKRIQDVCNTLLSDGLPVYVVDASSTIDPYRDFQADHIHPTESGHVKLANVFLEKMNIYSVRHQNPFIYNKYNNDIKFEGKLAIGTSTAQSETLYVGGTAKITSIPTLGTTPTYAIVEGTGGQLNKYAWPTSTGGSNWENSGYDIYRNSKVGIGISEVIAMLHVYGAKTTSDLLLITNDKDGVKDSTFKVDKLGNTSLGYIIGDVARARLDIAGSSSNQLRMGDGDQYYALGRSGSTGFLDFKGSQAGYTGYDFMSDDGTHLLTINDPGQLIALPTYSVTVGGTNRDLYIDNTGKIGYVSSSKRYKKNIINMESVAWLYDLNPVNFTYKTDTTGTKQYGLIAEDVEKVNKNIISYNEKGEVETVEYSKLIVPLLKALQDQQKRIEELEIKLNRLLKK